MLAIQRLYQLIPPSVYRSSHQGMSMQLVKSFGHVHQALILLQEFVHGCYDPNHFVANLFQESVLTLLKNFKGVLAES